MVALKLVGVPAMDMGIESMKQKAAGFLITLVNPRFANFNRTPQFRWVAVQTKKVHNYWLFWATRG